MNYSFIFLGDTIHGSDIEVIKLKIAKKFNVQPSEVEELFTKGAKFERRDLSKEVAIAYQDEFAEVGAVGHVLESTENESHSTTSNTATPLQPTIAPKDKPLNITSNKNTSSFWIKWAGICIVGVLAADNFLQSSLIVDSYGLDIGYFPLILAHIPLIIGCALLAKEKGFSQTVGIALGFFSLAGLSILILLPAKCILIFNISIFTYWVNGFWSNSSNIDELLLAGDQLHIGRFEFPQPRQSSHQDYVLEQQELYSYMDKIISAVESGSLRPDAITQLGNKMFSELARYAVWRKYQFFKHKTTKTELPEALTNDFLKKDAALFRNLFSRINQQNTPRLNEIASSWLVSPGDKERVLEEYKIGQRMGRIFDVVRDANLLSSSPRNKNKDQNPNITTFIQNLNLPEFANSQLTRHDNYINYSFNNGYSVTIGFYTHARKAKFPSNKKVHYSNRYVVIANQYPAKYLSKILGVFDKYNSLH